MLFILHDPRKQGRIVYHRGRNCHFASQKITCKASKSGLDHSPLLATAGPTVLLLSDSTWRLSRLASSCRRLTCAGNVSGRASPEWREVIAPYYRTHSITHEPISSSAHQLILRPLQTSCCQHQCISPSQVESFVVVVISPIIRRLHLG